MWMGSTWKNEIEFLNETIIKRSNWMMNNKIENFSFRNYISWIYLGYIFVYPPSIILIVVIIWFCVIQCVYKDTATKKKIKYTPV